METAQSSLCRELYELSGWDGDTPVTRKSVPAYDLRYLLRKLPVGSVVAAEHDTSPQRPHEASKCYIAWHDTADRQHIWQRGETPPDAACKLAIELFTRGIIKNANTKE